ncbi:MULTISPECIES: helix-turn-helix transcriptional regulator [unclassified Archaeoglobus]|jgi:predicted transcriptional regulator|uniref:helix-turn-helix transcriptional regulator n=1 Tax=unclassified Archaeoglobus TaxID=2643606 RepID=UPI0025BA087A|nr:MULTISPECIES: winged helix-turn-helix domain-containing protein [unclassified Archaeoglobus]
MGIFDALAASTQRREILKLLSEKPRTLKEIREITGISTSLVSRHIKKLNKTGLVNKKDSHYTITDKGEIIHLAMEKFNRIVNTIERDTEFWEIHDLSKIPLEFKLRIDEIGDYVVLRSEKDQVLRHYKVFSSIYQESKIVKVISAIFFPSHPQMFVEIASKADVEVITTEKTLRTLENEYEKELKAYLDNGGRIYYNDDVRFTVITTERALCVGLFLKDGKYDTESGLLSYDKSAIKWGFDLFEYFKRGAVSYP